LTFVSRKIYFAHLLLLYRWLLALWIFLAKKY
jgi:hypothetical protein